MARQRSAISWWNPGVVAEGNAAVCGRWPAARVVVVLGGALVVVVVGGRVVVVVLVVVVVVLVVVVPVVPGREPAEPDGLEPQEATTTAAPRRSARGAVRRTAER